MGKMAKDDTFHRSVNIKQCRIKRPQAVPKDQKNLREWVKRDSANISWKGVHNFFCKGDLNEVISSGTKGPKLSSGNVQANSRRLLMDDITTTTETIVQTSYLLNKLVQLY